MVKNLVKDKKGMSGIIITVIMIALALVMIGVVWAVISNIVSESSEDTESTASQLFSTAAELGLVKMEKGQNCYGTEVVCKDGLACDGIVPDQISGLVGYWDFDGDARDSSGEGNHGSIVGNPQFVDGVADDALEFDGVADYVDVGTLDSYPSTWSDPWSVSLWINIPSSYVWNTTYNSPIFSQGSYNGACGLWMHPNNNLLHANIRTDGGVYSANAITTINRDTWYYIVGTYDGATLKFYLDGEFQNSVVPTQTGIPDMAFWRIGHNAALGGAQGSRFTGDADEIRFYNRALTEEEITALYEVP